MSYLSKVADFNRIWECSCITASLYSKGYKRTEIGNKTATINMNIKTTVYP